MDIRKPSAILGSPLFIASVALLLVNDHYLKSVYPGFVTGKLSDVAGLFAFATFLSALFPRRRLVVQIITAIGFTFWKLPAADIVIEAANSLLPFTIGRTIDYSDLWALLILPASYAYTPLAAATNERLERWHIHSFRRAMVLLAFVTFCASVTVPVMTVKVYWYIATPAEMTAYIDSVLAHYPELRVHDGRRLRTSGALSVSCRLVDSSGPEIFTLTYSDVFTQSAKHKGLLGLAIDHVHAEGEEMPDEESPDGGRRRLDPTEQARIISKYEREFLPKLDVYIRQHPYP